MRESLSISLAPSDGERSRKEKEKAMRVDYLYERKQCTVCWDLRAARVICLHLPAGQTRLDQFTILHEYAHIALGVPSVSSMFSDGHTKGEIAASQLALQWIRPELQESAIRYYLSLIAATRYYRAKYRCKVEASLRA